MSLPQVGKIYTFTCMVFPDKRLNLCGSAGNGGNVAMINADENEITIEEQWKYHSSGKLLAMKNTSCVLDRYAASGTQYNNADVWVNDPDEDANQIVSFEETIFPNTVKIRLASTNLYLRANAGDGTSGGKSTTSAGNAYWDVSVGEDNELWVFSEVGATSGDEEDETEGQRLIMPINQSRITVGYKSNAPAYHEQAIKNGFSDPVHYAVDMVGTPRSFYASGDGTVVGYSTTDAGSLGKWLAVRYNNVIDIHGNNIGDVVFRYCHLDDIYKTSGEVHVDDASPMARYGSTGTGASSPHLHMEVDTDVEHPNKTPSLSGNSNGLVSGKNNDTTIDPFEIFYRKISIPEEQTVTPSQSYCDISNCTVCATQYPQYENGRVPYVNEAQCYSVPVLPE